MHATSVHPAQIARWATFAQTTIKYNKIVMAKIVSNEEKLKAARTSIRTYIEMRTTNIWKGSEWDSLLKKINAYSDLRAKAKK